MDETAGSVGIAFGSLPPPEQLVSSRYEPAIIVTSLRPLGARSSATASSPP